MIYGPFSTGWRDERAREMRRAAAVRALGLVVVGAASVALWAWVLL